MTTTASSVSVHAKATRDAHSIAGDTILVTGGASGIGAEIVTELATAGAEVIVADLAPPEQRVPGVDYHHVDITDDQALTRLAAETRDRFGTVDALVNCAALYKALGTKKSLLALTNEDWDAVLRINVRGTWQVIKAIVPLMQDKGGHIVNISSTTVRNGTVGFPHYIASKAAVEGLTRAAARELGAYGITVNVVAPGLVDDEATNVLNDSDYVAQAVNRRSIKRTMVPSDVATVVRFLCTEASGFVSGQTVIVDGGGVFG